MFLALVPKLLTFDHLHRHSITLVLFTHPLILIRPSRWLSTITSSSIDGPSGRMGDYPSGSCPQDPPRDTTKRTAFGRLGCLVYGYPSSGGVLIKQASIVDLHFLSLDHLHPSQRSSNVLEEDRFCDLMRRLGATWWASEQEWVDVKLGVRQKTEREKRVLEFGWPTDGVGVWVLRFASEREVPKDFGRVKLAVNMDERVQVMREYGAVFYEDEGALEELREGL